MVDDVSENPFTLKCLEMMGKLQAIHIEIQTYVHEKGKGIENRLLNGWWMSWEVLQMRNLEQAQWGVRIETPVWAKALKNKEKWGPQSKPQWTLTSGISNSNISGKQRMLPKWISKTHNKTRKYINQSKLLKFNIK